MSGADGLRTRGAADPRGSLTSTPVPDASAFAKQLAENSAIYVQRAGAGEAGRHTGLLIGNIRNQMLVLGLYDGVDLGIGERIIVRMGMGAHLVGFDTEVEKKTEDPQLVFVKFPTRIEAVNLRKAQRIQAFFPADVQVEKPGSRDQLLLKTRVLDISAGGCSFRSKTKLPGASALSISFALPGERLVQSVKGAVIESAQVGLVFHTRAKFISEPSSVPMLQEVAKWVAEGLSFASE